jgi:hypothetical protein
MRDFHEEFVKVPEEPVSVGELRDVQEPSCEELAAKMEGLFHAHNLRCRPKGRMTAPEARGEPSRLTLENVFSVVPELQVSRQAKSIL